MKLGDIQTPTIFDTKILTCTYTHTYPEEGEIIIDCNGQEKLHVKTEMKCGEEQLFKTEYGMS